MVAVLLASGGAAYGAYVSTTAGTLLGGEFIAGPPAEPVNGRFNFMLLGGDAGGDREGLRPDSMTVVSIDATTGAATMIGIPRNMLYAPFPADSPMAAIYPNGYGTDGCEVESCLLNSIYTEVELYYPDLYPNAAAEGSSPGIEATRDALEGITGLTIQYFVLVDMLGFADLVDALGGVTVTVETAVPIYGEDFNVIYEYIGPGVVTLDGYHALWYARTRHDTNDYDRMARQRQLIEAILEQFSPAGVLGKFQEIATAGGRLIDTDVPQTALGFFVGLADKTREQPITNFGLDPNNGVDPESPQYDYIHELVAGATAPPAHRRPRIAPRHDRRRAAACTARVGGRVAMRAAGAAARQNHRSACSCQTLSAALRQVKTRDRSRPPMPIRSAKAGFSSSERTASASRSGYCCAGSSATSTPAPADTSDSAGASEWTTGVPRANASTIGRPKPSSRLG